MNPLLNLKTTIRFLRNSMSCSPLRGGLFLIALGLACFGLLPEARAVCQEGCSGSNTFLGEDALILNTGYNNTASGYQALLGNTTGYDNTATGSDAVAGNNGNYNTATGYLAMSGVSISVESIGFNNTATGAYALKNIFNGQNNTATGYAAMQGSEANLGSSGNNNTASGAFALFSNTTGSENTAMGVEALSSNTTAGNNVAVGFDALTFNTEGSANTATGVDALWVKLVLVTKGDRFQRQDRLAGPVHRLDCIFETR